MTNPETTWQQCWRSVLALALACALAVLWSVYEIVIFFYKRGGVK